MNPRLARLVLMLWLNASTLLCTGNPLWADDAASTLAGQVQELFASHCWSCHAGAGAKAKLDLSSVDSIRSHRRDVLGDIHSAKLLRMISGERPRMPKGRKPLSDEAVNTVRRWILAGAPEFPRETGEQWWAFLPVQTHDVPDGKNHPVDAFLAAKHTELGLHPAARADRRALVRRAYVDLHGLPPTPQEMEQFLSDPSPDAFANLVDRLLESPRYGERWGRHWLDVVRYADTGGFETDIYFPNAWRYRDYVINSLNDDKPFDRFVEEQIAGDELWPDDLELRGTFDIPESKQRHLEARIATGVFSFGPVYHEAALNGHQLRYEWMTDAVDTLGEAFLGLTITCARCHDHKFDPISQRDYHRLMDVFAGSRIRTEPVVHKMSEFGFFAAYPKRVRVEQLRRQLQRIDSEAKSRAVDAIVAEFSVAAQTAYLKTDKVRTPQESELAGQIEAALSEAGLRENADGRRVEIPLTSEEVSRRQDLIRQLGEAALDARFELPSATVLGRSNVVYPVYLTTRGDYRQTGDRVTAGVPTVFTHGAEVNFTSAQGGDGFGRRRELALWLTSPDNPLVTRVIVNRLWQGHFGQGLVATPNNFGLQSDPPDFPRLLDYLASRFVNEGWSLKQMHRLIMTSDAYQRSTQFDAMNAKVDANNRYFWRMNRRRLEAEVLRDHVLAVSGALNLKMGGEPVVVPLTDEEKSGMWALDQWPETMDRSEHVRRSVYLYVKRSFPLPMFTTFDSPETSVSCGRRETTTVAPQALTLLNSQFMIEQAKRFADRVIGNSGPEDESRVRYAWNVALGREPTGQELATALSLVGATAAAEDRKTTSADARVRFTRLALAVFNINEFVYVD